MSDDVPMSKSGAAVPRFPPGPAWAVGADRQHRGPSGIGPGRDHPGFGQEVDEEDAQGVTGGFVKSEPEPASPAETGEERRKPMKIREIMTPDVHVVSPAATLEEAAKQMRELDVGSLPVCDGEQLVGMLTDRDITLRATAEGKDPRATLVRDAMTPDVAYCYEDQDVEEAVRKMELHQMRRLLILDREKRLAGIVSVDDLAARAPEEGLADELLEEVAAA